MKSLDGVRELEDWVIDLKFGEKRSVDVTPRDSREGRPGPGITWMALEAVGAAAVEVRRRERRMLGGRCMAMILGEILFEDLE